jgi:N-acetylglucosaminyldiphosphoundecaprenol N-acetyl-beta-D-mannosaminyltransferase
MSTQTTVEAANSSTMRPIRTARGSGFAVEQPCANVLGVQVEALHMEQAVCRIAEMLRSKCKGYVCAIGVHSVMEAQRDTELAAAFAGAAIAVPDGMPIVWVGRLQGHSRMRRVAGPDLMLEVFRRVAFARCRHFLYGGNEGVADQLAINLKRRFPTAQIVGTYTPPFRILTREEEMELIAQVELCKPDIFWVGISTPKQEKFMRSYLPKLNTRLMFGVGAAFDFHSGRIKDSPAWVKEAGLQWLHRVMQEPRRLFWRYLRNNPLFLWRIALQLSGLKTYSPLPMAREKKVCDFAEDLLQGNSAIHEYECN